MKVAVITERSEVLVGGAERSVFELTAELITQGIKVRLLAAKGQGQAKHVSVLCPDAPGKRFPISTFAAALERHFAQNRYDIIHSVLPFSFADVYQPRGGTYPETIAQHAASYESAFIGAFKRFTSFMNERRAQLAKAERDLCNNPSGPTVAALSNYVAGQLRNYYGLGDERIAVIQNGIKIDRPIDLAEFAEVKNEICARRTGPKPVFFLFAAHNFRLKGLSPLIKATQMATDNAAPAKPHLFVAGAERSGPYHRMCKRLGIADSVTFLGNIPHVQNALAVSDVAVLPTFYDPASRFILEALAMGKPVITTRYNGATDLFTNGRHGIVIDEPTQIEKLAQAILYFCDSANINKAAAAITADKLKEELSIERHTKELIELYKRIIAKRNSK
jgi:UDP-glucose:(heptosyl)LPS alpha-1,3-glucosyltransferase